MPHVLAVARTLNNIYRENHRTDMDELRIHKMLYFIQKEYIARYNRTLFEEKFEGWRFGPVMRCVRNAYRKRPLFQNVTEILEPQEEAVVRTVCERYAKTSTWELINLSHQEFSWLYARDGLRPEQNGHVRMTNDSIAFDVLRSEIDREYLNTLKQNQ